MKEFFEAFPSHLKDGIVSINMSNCLKELINVTRLELDNWKVLLVEIL